MPNKLPEESMASRKTKILLAGETQRIKKPQAAFMQLTQ
jgi:hypothetical protein